MTQSEARFKKELVIRFEPGYQKCNYTCPYCIIGWEGLRHGNWDEERFKVIINKIKQLPYMIHLLFGVEGEIFTSRLLLDTIKDLSKSENISDVYLITNLSSKENTLKRFLEEAEETKLSFACTLHDEADLADFSNKIYMLYDRRIPVIVGSVGVPNKLLKLIEIKRMFGRRGVPMYVNALLGSYNGKTFPKDYNLFERLILRKLMYSSYEYKYMVKMKSTFGQLCNAGSTYVYLNYDGKIFRCGEEKNRTFTPIGDLINGDFKLSSNPLQCRCQNCLCPIESFSTLEFQKKYISSKNRRIYKKKPLVQIVKEKFQNNSHGFPNSKQ